MQFSRIIAVAALVATSSSVSLTAARADACIVRGNPAACGINIVGAIEIKSGESCTWAIAIDGVFKSSKIIKRPKHGTATMLNMSTVEYKSKAGYKGADSFAIQATGSGPSSSGTSVVTVNMTMK